MKCLKVEFESPKGDPRRRVSLWIGGTRPNVVPLEWDNAGPRRIGILHVKPEEELMLLQLLQDGSFAHQLTQFEAGAEPLLHVMVVGRERDQVPA